MRRFSVVLVFCVALGTLHTNAEPVRDERSKFDARASITRIVRVIKSKFKVKAESDALTPPWPAAPARP